MKIIITILLLAGHCFVQAQKANTNISNGNKLYKKQDYTTSLNEYQKALAVNANDPTALYNSGNATFKSNNIDDAIKNYDATIASTKNKNILQKAYYNKGVALAKQKKLAEAVDALKQSVKINTEDNEARENLQKAMEELKQQQKQKEEEKKQQQKEQQKPKEQENKLNKKQAEQLLNAMQQKEKELQKKMQSKNASSSQPEKDW